MATEQTKIAPPYVKFSACNKVIDKLGESCRIPSIIDRSVFGNMNGPMTKVEYRSNVWTQISWAQKR